MLGAIKECQRFLDQKGLKVNVDKYGSSKVLPVKGKPSIGTWMVGWISNSISRLYQTAKWSQFLHSTWQEDCCTMYNIEDKTVTINVLLLDTYTKGSSNKTKHMLHYFNSAPSVWSRPQKSSEIKVANSRYTEKDIASSNLDVKWSVTSSTWGKYSRPFDLNHSITKRY